MAQSRRVRLGMVGGGRGAFIGAVHRLAARMDDRYVLLAGALSSDSQRARDSGADLGLDPARCYESFQAMAEAEAQRPDGIEAVAVVTPNDSHHAICRAFLDRGIHVICDKPMTTTLEDALDLVGAVKRSGLAFVLTHNYTGYPMVRQAREMVSSGALGEIRVVQVEYAQDWLSTPLETTGSKQAGWRTDPERAGAGGALGDIGVHAHNLAAFVSGQWPGELCADLSSFVPGRRLDDNANILLRYGSGARGMLWASQVSPGNENTLRLQIYGEKAGLAWSQEFPNQLRYTPLGQPPQTLGRGQGYLGAAAAHATRVPPGHPEGYQEAFAMIYRDAAELIRAKQEGRPADPQAMLLPTVEDGARGVKFILAAVESSRQGAAWTDCRLCLP
jgi:predicted dehydrogenase